MASDMREAVTIGDGGLTARQLESPPVLLLRAAGGPRQWADKIDRLVRTVRLQRNRHEIRARLRRLQAKGFMDTIPNRWQLLFGGLDMVRYMIAPGAKDYYAIRGINFTFHQILRFLDDPVSIVDPVGVLSEKDTIIGHVLQVVHLNPLYDLQLLEMFEDGLDEMERQTRQMVEGTHPRQATIGAIVEDADYHRQLLDYILRYRRDPDTPQLRRARGRLSQDPAFALAEETFGELPGFMRYAARLPRTLPGLLRHWLIDRTINPDFCDPDVVERVRSTHAANHTGT